MTAKPHSLRCRIRWVRRSLRRRHDMLAPCIRERIVLAALVLLLLLAAELFRGFAFVADGSLSLAVRDRRVDPRGPFLRLDGCRPEYEPQHDEEYASEDRREEQHLAFALPLELRRRVVAHILVVCHNGLRFQG